MADTKPDKLDPTTVEGYEPPVEGETSKERRNRRARNRRRAERAQADAEGKREPTASTIGKGKAGPGRPSVKSKREQAVLGILTGAGVAVLAFDEFDGTTIIEGAPDLARSLANLADKRPAVARALDALTETSAWAEVAVAAGSIIVPIVRHHAAKPPEVEPEPTTQSTAGDHSPQPTAAEPEPARQVAEDAPVFTVRPPDDTDPVPTFRA